MARTAMLGLRNAGASTSRRTSSGETAAAISATSTASGKGTSILRRAEHAALDASGVSQTHGCDSSREFEARQAVAESPSLPYLHHALQPQLLGHAGWLAETL